MKEKFEKEILTKERIKKDIVYLSFKENSVISFAILLVAIMWTLLFAYIFDSQPINFDSPGVLIDLILIAYVCSWYVAFLYLLFKLLKQLRLIKNNKYKIITDELKTFDFVAQRRGFDYYILVFSYDRRYALPRGKNYKWSRHFCMKDKEICDRSEIGDKFYLVVTQNEKKILSAYNTNFFELQE